jgi:hypothetical protein
MRHLKPWDYRMMPWKNGQGSTLELVIDPPEAGLSGTPFLWRLSIATVSASGPFSRFPGYERHIMLIEGNGMTINANMDGLFELVPLKPVVFSGDWHVTGHLTDGPVRDFNLMFARAKLRGTLDVVNLAETQDVSADGGTVAVYFLEGSAEGYGEGDSLILSGDETIRLRSATDKAKLIVARLQTKSESKIVKPTFG